MFDRYDIIVIGGGHAGCEASVAAAKMGAKVLLITMNLNNLGYMSCNPAIGGIAKGQIVREIDALGGMTGIIADHATIQFRMLNKSKGPAMWSPRVQIDRNLFSLKWRETIESYDNIHLWQDIVEEIITKNDNFKSVKTHLGIEIEAKACIISGGTFLNGKIFIGRKEFSGGRLGEKSSSGLAESLKRYGIRNEKLKTGTSARLDGRSIDFSKLIEQAGDLQQRRFSFLSTPIQKEQKSCFLAYTNEKVHNILRKGFDDSPLFKGIIKGVGPRYCPSIEDKLVKFKEKDKHQLFLEPEGMNTCEYYINGFASSLPEEIQYEALKSVEGLENVRILKPGYGIEYEFFPPTQLKYSLESKVVNNLFFAGQVNGTTGYEEAACQGLIAGINAYNNINDRKPIILDRSQAYIGVLIDDLISKGTNEPYRMFTSRAEYRLLLRQDNADIRLTPLGYDLGLCTNERQNVVNKKKEKIESIINFLHNNKVTGSIINNYLIEHGSSPLKEKSSLRKLITRPQVSIFHLYDELEFFKKFVDKLNLDYYKIDTLEEVEILIKYEGYIKKEEELIDKVEKFKNLKLKYNFDYMKLKGLSIEARQKLQEIKPGNMGQASRISGISPADISVLLIYLRG